jgi:hypothetical protein
MMIKERLRLPKPLIPVQFRAGAPLWKGSLVQKLTFRLSHWFWPKAAGWKAEAHSFYERALALTGSDPERRFLEKRLRELG